ncbi:uncharacterized protein [Amphiura filiformis]|uniref:uncharacterized protein n=1 Tax=Amphiura filiformis TaxID=82378 RepID=UPI003B21565B
MMALLHQTFYNGVQRGCLHSLASQKAMLKLAHHSWRCLATTSKTNKNGYLKLLPSVASALANNQPVVALESTIITHGMPYPHNLRTAQDVERIVQDNGVTPATVGLLNGSIHVGLSEEELVAMATAQNAVKSSRRDLSWVLSKRLTGGTTVSATMVAAHKADIPVFVTGGIGGVHRDGENSLDVSADLTELGRTPVAVVSAGVKSILDIPKTLEYLETQGVTVATFGPNKDFPAFFTPNSGVQSPINVTDAKEAAELIDCSLSLGLQSGILIAVPIPQSLAADGDLIEGAIQQALSEAKNQGITGKEVTPFILQRVNELTQGKSLQANEALIRNNALIGSQIAKELADLRRCKGQSSNQNNNCNNRTFPEVKGHEPGGRPVVIGASIVDLLASVNQDNIMHTGRTYQGSLQVAYGGVGRNIADCLSRLGSRPLFISAVGNDEHAQALLTYCKNMDQSAISTLSDYNTGTYCAVLDNQGELLFGIGDMDINDQITPQMVSTWESSIAQSPLVCMDGNIPTETIEYVCRICKENHVPVWYEPTCQMKAKKPFQSDAWKSLTYVSPNLNELRMMYGSLEGEETVNFDYETSFTDQLRECLQLSRILLQHIDCLVITLGENGALIVRNTEPEDKLICGKTNREDEELLGMTSAVHYPIGNVDPDRKITSVSGAGDCLSAGIIHSILQGYDSDTCIKAGMMVAQMTLEDSQPVPACITASTITPETVQKWAPWQPSRMM